MTSFLPFAPKKPELKFAATASIITNPSKSVIKAIQSWRDISKSVFLFNSPNDLNGEVNNVTYVTADSYPCSLSEILGKLARETYGGGIGVLVHEDVFIQPEAIKAITISSSKSLGNAWAATARAKEYSPVSYAKTEAFSQVGLDNGYRCFITTSSAFKAMEKACPKSIRAGTQEANDWVASFMSAHIQVNRYHDIEGLSPFWVPQRKKDPKVPESGKVIKGPPRRYI